jgi:hypothetical protein
MDENGMFARVLREFEQKREREKYLASREKRQEAKREARVAQVRGAAPRGDSNTSTTVEQQAYLGVPTTPRTGTHHDERSARSFDAR